LTRAAAARLLELRPVPESGVAGIQRVLGLLSLRTLPEPGSGPAELKSIRLAVEEAEALGDPDTIQWTLATAARAAWGLRETADAERFAMRVVESHGHAQHPAPHFWSPGQAAGTPLWIPEPRVCRTLAAVGAADIATSCSSASGDFEQRTERAAKQAEIAEAVSATWPRIYARAVQRQVQVRRAQGNWPGVRALMDHLAGIAADDGPEREVKRVIAACHIGTAEVMNDRSRALQLEKERLALLTAAVRDQAPPEIGLETVPAILDFLKSRGDREYRAAIGNSYLGQADALYRIGALDNDPSAQARALELLALAERAYEGYGNNGITAVRRSRVRVLERSGRIPSPVAAAEMLEIADLSLQPALRRNVLLEAARWCVPGDVRVRDRVVEGLSGPVSTHTPRYRVAYAVWLLRAAEAESAAGREAGWERVLQEASRAGEELVVGGRLVAPLLSAEMWEAAWRAHERLHGDLGLGDRMVLALNAVQALATQLVALTVAQERARIASLHGHVFADAAALAVRVGDPDAAELVMEAARRERVGMLLGELAHNPRVSEVVREAAEGIIVANTASPEEGSFRDGSRALAWQARSADAIQASRRAAVEAAASVIGPAAALADLSRRPVPVAPELARCTAGRSVAAVLQLYRPVSDQGSVYWAVEATDGTSACGRADLPVPLPRIGDTGFWNQIHRTGTALVPGPLRRLLLANHAAGRAPVSLTVVPSGLLGIPFDQIGIGEDLFLLEAADVVMTGSLAMALALHHLPAGADASDGWVSVYDHTKLTHTRTESEALAACHAPVEVVTGRDGLFAALATRAGRPALMAMGLHGTEDETGWAQTKVLPDGTTVVAAEALAWEAPPVAVLSSCHSRLETVDGTELSGFPAALLLRGSHTVIGSLTKIDDRATAEIISLFWGHTATGRAPAHALAQAKRDWIAQDTRHRTGAHALWAPLIAYGTHPTDN
jgi:hypothetical protein